MIERIARFTAYLKKLMGHIAFGVSVSGCVSGCVTLFVPTVTFKPLKLESLNFICGFLKKNS